MHTHTHTHFHAAFMHTHTYTHIAHVCTWHLYTHLCIENHTDKPTDHSECVHICVCVYMCDLRLVIYSHTYAYAHHTPTDHKSHKRKLQHTCMRYVCVCACVRVCVCVCVYVCLCCALVSESQITHKKYIFTHKYAAHTYTHPYAQTHTQRYLHKYTCFHTHTYIFIYKYLCV